MVMHLLRDFVPEAMSVRLDFSRMERVNAKFHGGCGRRREGDVVWRIPTIDGSDRAYPVKTYTHYGQDDRRG